VKTYRRQPSKKLSVSEKPASAWRNMARRRNVAAGYKYRSGGGVIMWRAGGSLANGGNGEENEAINENQNNGGWRRIGSGGNNGWRKWRQLSAAAAA